MQPDKVSPLQADKTLGYVLTFNSTEVLWKKGKMHKVNVIEMKTLVNLPRLQLLELSGYTTQKELLTHGVQQSSDCP